MNKTSFSRRHALLGIGAVAAGAAVSPRAMAANAVNTVDVLVLGAGIAGLHAARRLQAAGLRVAVLEGSGRIGGRCWTAFDVPGRPEFGASQIASAYTRVVANCRELGLELVAPGAFLPDHVKVPGVAISLGGQPAPAVPWSRSPQNALSDAERDVLPVQLISHYVAKANPLQAPDDWLKPEFAALDALPVDEFLRRQGASKEALRLADAFSPAHTLSDMSTLDVMHKDYAFRWYSKQGPYFHVAKGTAALTDAMAASLTEPVHVGRVVTRIRAERRNVEVQCADGSRWRGRAALCTFPTSTLARVEVDAPLPEAQRASWSRLAYAKATIVYLRAKEPFWERDGLPPATWSDVAPEYAVLVSTLPDGGGVIMCHINGNATDRYRGMSTEAIGQQVLEAYVRARPAAAGLVSVVAAMDWNAWPFSLGHIAYFRPGDIGRYAGLLGRPAGRLFFAGEHCGRAEIGLEGACESADVAVAGIGSLLA